MKSKIILTCKLMVLTLFFACQKKYENMYSNEMPVTQSGNGVLLRSSSSTDSLAERLMADFGLIILSSEQMGNTQFPSFSDYQSAADYINLMKQRLNQNVNATSSISSGPSIERMGSSKSNPLLLPADCSAAGTYHANLAGSGGFFSSFNVYFNNSSSGVTSASVYTTGTPIGWSWSQVATSFSGSGYSGCVGGYITHGLTIGNLTIGWQQAYHFNFTFNGTTCTLSFSQGSGHC